MKKTITLLLILIACDCFAQTVNTTEIELNFSGDSSPENITKGNTKIYFSADDGINYEELWVHDIVTNETHMVKNISLGADGIDYNSIFLTVGDILYFTPNPSVFGIELWRSDGTESGTYLIKHIGDYAGPSTITSLTYYNGNIFFAAYNNTVGRELWISDGTTNGTVLLKDIYNGAIGSNPDNFFVFNGYLYFTADDVTNGRELWKSDGTLAGTNLFKDIYPGSNGGVLGNVIKMNNNFYFYASDNGSNGFELWKSDGTNTGTAIFKDIIPGLNSSNYGLYGAATNNYFIFEVISTNGTELWKCDGTVAGTTLLKDIYAGSNSGVSVDTQFAVLNNKIYFDATTAANGLELWVTDGTTIGTQLLKDIRTGINNSNITKLTATSNYLVFSAQGDTNSYNTIWKSDGTTNGTFELKNVNLSLYSNTNLSFVEFNNKVFFPAGYNSLNGIELWTTDGTIANTSLFKDIFHRYSGMTDFFDTAELGDKLIFTGNNGNGNESEPFITDGTVNGTRIINTGGGVSFFTSNGFRGASYTKAGNYVFFRGSNTTSGYEIWKTDGITASMVKDIKVGSGSSITEYPLFMVYNDIFYFKADDGVHGEELWRSDGTNAGTYMLKDINPGSGYAFDGQSNIYYNTPNYGNEKCFAVLNGFLYFAAYDGTDSSIWKTDGTTSGTVKAIAIPSSGVNDNRRVVINSISNKIFFKSNINNSTYGNNTLWSSDGTQTSAAQLYSTPITGVIQYKRNIVHNNELYFTVFDNNGWAIMKSDGTLGGTVIIKDHLNTQYTFNALQSCGNYVYFGMGTNNSIASTELWRTNGVAANTIKIGDLTSTPLQNFYYCNTCIQGNLLFKRQSYNEDKIYYVNDNTNNVNNYLTTNIVNSENFGEIGYHIYSNFYNFNDKLLFAAAKEYAGTELFSSDFNFSSLNTHDIVNNGNKNNLVVYPNPAKNIINIKTNDGQEITKVKVYDLLGKQVYNSNSNREYDLSHLGQGIYIVNVATDKSEYSSKLVISK